MAPVDNLVVFTRARAAELSGLSLRQLDYWRETGLVVPSADEHPSGHRRVVLYDFIDMQSLMTIVELHKHSVPTRRIRRIVDRARSQRGLSNPLVQIRYGVASSQDRKRHYISLKFEDGSVEGDDLPGQPVMEEVLVDVAAIRASLRRAATRGDEVVGLTESRRGVMGGRERFAGTRIPVSAVRAFLEEGAEDGEILEAFPALRRADIDAVRAASA